MTYRGAIAITDTKTLIPTGTNAFKNASLIMLNKISSILSILSFLISLTTIGAGYTAYKWVTSPNFEKMMMEKVMGKVSGLMPKALDQAMPGSTGISIPKF